MGKAIAFIKEFIDNLVKMLPTIFYISCFMIFVAGLLMAYASVPFYWAMSTILLPPIFGVVIAMIIAYEIVRRGWSETN